MTQADGTGLVDATVVGNDGTAILRDVTLLAEPGEVLVVLGPSGSGKTTMLRAIAGLRKVAGGQVLVDGRDVTRSEPWGRGVAMIFEHGDLVPFLDVAENLGLGLRLKGVAKPEIGERVRAQAIALRLAKLLQRRPAALSAGEQRQVGIGRALVQRPAAFLMDEPLAHHDALGREQMRRHIADEVRRLGVTTIYVTHDQSQACGIADRIAVLNKGVVCQVGTPGEIYHQPVDTFVAGFVGTPPIGLLPARLISAAGLAGFRVGLRTLPLWAPVPDQLRDHVDRGVVLGVRPEHVGPASHDTPADSVTLPASVIHQEFTGSHTVVRLAVAADTEVSLHARFPAHARVAVGERVDVTVDVSRAHVFDPVSGRALCHLDGRPASRLRSRSASQPGSDMGSRQVSP